MTDAVVFDNGVRTVLLHRPGMVGTALVIHVGVGYGDDPIGVPGAAHLLEHLITQDAPPPATSGSLALVQAAGGTAGATTHPGHTEFWYHLPTSLLPAVLERESARLARPLFTPDHHAAQLDGITAEIDERSATGWGRLPWPALPPLLYDDWRRGHDGLGDPEILRDLTHGDCLRLHAELYLRAPIVVAVAADLGPARPSMATVLRLVRETYGTLPDRAVPDAARVPSSAPTGRSAEVGVPAQAVGLTATALVVPTTGGDPLAGPLSAAVLARALRQADGGPLAAGVGWHAPLDTSDDEVLVLVDRPGTGGAARTAARLEALARPEAGAALRAAAAQVRRELGSVLDEGVTAARWAGRGELLRHRPGLVSDAVASLALLDVDSLRAAAARLATVRGAVATGVPAPDHPDRRPRTPTSSPATALPARAASGQLLLPRLPALPDGVEHADSGLLVLRAPRQARALEARLVVALPGLGARRRQRIVVEARTLCARAGGFRPPVVRWMGDVLVVAAQHERGARQEEAAVAGWAELSEGLRDLAATAEPGPTGAGPRPDWVAADLASGPGPVPAIARLPAALVLVGPVTGVGRDPWPARPDVDGIPTVPPTADIATAVLPGSPAAAAVLLGPAAPIESAPAHLAVAVLAGAGRRDLGTAAPRTLAANGLLAAGREPAAVGPARPFVRASSAPGRLTALLAELDGVLRHAAAVPDHEVLAAATFCRGQWALAHDDPASHADQLAQHLAFGGTPDAHARFADDVRATAPDDVRRALATLFDPASLRGGAVDVVDVALPEGWTGASLRSNPRTTPGWRPRGACGR